MLTVLEKDPFRVFFPLGFLLALVGTFPWSLYLFGISNYPIEFHRMVMMNGFMLSFVIGFLMTAIPRFTSAGFAKTPEIFSALVLIIAASVLSFFELRAYHHLLAGLALVVLIVFAIKRFRRRKANPPFTFVFVGLGLILWTISNFVISGSLFIDDVRPRSTSIWGDLFSNGALMAIVLGVGGRLIPGILGWQDIVNTQRDRYENTESFLKAVPALVWVLVLIYLLSFFLLPWVSAEVLLWLRALVIAVFAFKYWKLYLPPKDKSFLTWGIWLACWCFAAGSVLLAVWPGLYTHLLHGILVGGFSLLTVLIATRVTLAHGSEGKEAEKKSYFLPGFTALLLFAMLTRVTAPIWPKIYFTHLSYAALTWLLGLVLWGYFCIPKMFKVKAN